MGSVAATKILYRETSGRNLLYGSVTAPETVKSAFFPDEKSRRLVNKTDPRKKTPEKSPGKPVLAKRETQDLNRPILKSLVAKSIVTGNVTGNKFPDTNAVPGETFHGRNAVLGKVFPVRNPVSGKVLLDRTAVYEGSAILNSTYFPGLAANFNSRLIVLSDPVFEPEPVIDRFPAKGVYPQASGKELVFNTGAGVSQELEQEVAAIKEELLKAEQASQTSYSSLYSKIEKELKQKLEINRISEQVLQQIVWRLKIEKERRGLL